MEDLQDSALPAALARGGGREAFTDAGQVLKLISAQVGAFGQDAINLSTTAIRSSSDATYTSLEHTLTDLVIARDSVSGPLAAQLEAAVKCDPAAAQRGRPTDPDLSQQLRSLAAQGRTVLDRMERELDGAESLIEDDDR
jgi:hypothetical protein